MNFLRAAHQTVIARDAEPWRIAAQHFITHAVWDVAPVWRSLLRLLPVRRGLIATCNVRSTRPDLRALLEWVERDEAAGVGEAPYPPNFPKMPGEPPRVQPSRARQKPGR